MVTTVYRYVVPATMISAVRTGAPTSVHPVVRRRLADGAARATPPAASRPRNSGERRHPPKQAGRRGAGRPRPIAAGQIRSRNFHAGHGLCHAPRTSMHQTASDFVYLPNGRNGTDVALMQVFAESNHELSLGD